MSRLPSVLNNRITLWHYYREQSRLCENSKDNKLIASGAQTPVLDNVSGVLRDNIQHQ